MNQQQILHEISELPLFAQQEVVDFIAFLRTRYSDLDSASIAEDEIIGDLEDEPFIGMWKDREDMEDSIQTP